MKAMDHAFKILIASPILAILHYLKFDLCGQMGSGLGHPLSPYPGERAQVQFPGQPSSTQASIPLGKVNE